MAKVTIKVYFVVCNNEGVPDSEGMTTVRVGCKVHLDMNAKDADNKPVETVGDPVWNYDRLDLIEVHEDTFTPYLFVKAPGELRVQGEVDGVTSNELLFHFYQ